VLRCWLPVLLCWQRSSVPLIAMKKAWRSANPTGPKRKETVMRKEEDNISQARTPPRKGSNVAKPKGKPKEDRMYNNLPKDTESGGDKEGEQELYAQKVKFWGWCRVNSIQSSMLRLRQRSKQNAQVTTWTNVRGRISFMRNLSSLSLACIRQQRCIRK